MSTLSEAINAYADTGFTEHFTAGASRWATERTHCDSMPRSRRVSGGTTAQRSAMTRNPCAPRVA